MITYTLEQDLHNPIMYYIWREKDTEDNNEPPGKSILAIIYRDWVLAERIVAELNGTMEVKK